MISERQIRESEFCKQLFDRHLLENTHAQNSKNGMNASFQPKSMPYNNQKGVYSKGTPDLYFHSVGFTSIKCFDPNVHLDPFEEKLDRPSSFVKICDDNGGELEIVGKKDQILGCLRITVDDAAQLFRVSFFRFWVGESNDLVRDDTVTFRNLGVAPVELHVRFGASDKIGSGLVDTFESSKINISSVKQVEAPGFKADRVQPIDVMNLAISDLYHNWKRSTKIKLRVNLNSGLACAEACPRKDRQAEINCCGVDGVYRGLQVFNIAGLIGTQFSSSSNEQHSELFKDAKVTGRIRIGECAPSNRSSEAKMIELLLSRSKTVLNISQAFPESELSECENKHVVPGREGRGFVVTPVLADKPSKITLRKEVDDLRENKASRMHGLLLYPNIEKNRPKSIGLAIASTSDINGFFGFNRVEIAASLLRR